MSAWTARPLPTGTITFLFTDVEGSTRLWEQHPQAMRAVMVRHDALLTDVFERHDGVVVRPRGEGDSLFAVFVRASDALAAALDGQRALAAEDWGAVGPLRVRMGLHTGEADLREGDYYGAAVNRCARLRAAGHGGQILLSEATAKLARETLPAGARLRTLGSFRLRDLSEPEAIFQLDAPGLRDAFPPLKTLESRPNNLPLQLTSFLGRERELAEVAQLLRQTRLLTLTGPGGTGKTRLALQIAAEVLEGFPDGVFFVDLAPLSDPELVSAAIARVLDVPERPDLPPRDSVARFLREKRLLLVLDNFEHLLAAAEFASVLLQAAPALTLLVTSRAPLRVNGEREYPVSPLPLQQAGTETVVAESPAMALFVTRARDVRPDFALTAANTAAVASICERLDGLPLAIELAAARVRALPPAALLARLEHPLALLTGGRRDAPNRQQTIRSTIAWSYALLEPAEQRLFRRLGVFSGGCGLEAIESICDVAGDLGVDPLDGVSSLVEKSLVRELSGDADEPRYGLLETVREFALEKLAEAGEAAALGRRHAETMTAMAEAAGEALTTQSWAAARSRLGAERHNLQAAHDWAVAHQDAELALRLTGAAWLQITSFESVAIGTAWARRALALPGADSPTAARAGALRTLGNMLSAASDYRSSIAALNEAAALFRALDRRRDLSITLSYLASNYPPTSRTAAGLLEESAALANETGDPFAQYIAQLWRAVHRWQRGEYGAARAAAEACLAAAQRLGQPHTLTNGWRILANIVNDQEDPNTDVYVAQMMAAAHGPGAGRVLPAGPLVLAGNRALLNERYEEAQAAAIEGLGLVQAYGLRNSVDGGLIEVLACAWTAQGRMQEQAARLLGADAHLHDGLAMVGSHRLTALVEQAAASLRRSLGDAVFEAAYEAGRNLSSDEAVAEALATAQPGVMPGDVSEQQQFS